MKFPICFLILFHGSQSLVPGPIVRIDDGELQGIIEDSMIGKKYVSFKGIPYGKPPIGQLRFRDPIPAEPWTTRLNASKYGPICAQRDLVTGDFTGSDDCLYLNVYTPPDFNPTGSPLKSVMFWIYGGSFSQGSGDDALHGPDYLVAKDVILVTMNYRLGVFGFLNVEDEAATGNQGLKDQVLALKWVQKNIQHFGGNPNSVTIFGESAGSASVHYLTLSTMADGLYHKAIAQSGVALNPWAYLPYSPKIHAEGLAAKLGNSTKDPKKLVEFLRSIDAIQLARTEAELTDKIPYEVLFVPSVDSKSRNPIFPRPVKSVVGRGVKVPLMIGYMKYEGMLYLTGVNDDAWKILNSDISQSLNPGSMALLNEKGLTVEKLREKYFGDKNVSYDTRINFVDMQSDIIMIYGIHDVVAIQASKHNCPQTYLYNFTYDSGVSEAKEALGINEPGASHSDDVAFLLYPKYKKEKGLAPEGSKTRLVVDRVTQMWTDFAKTGNPTPTVSTLVPVIWEPVNNVNNFKYMEIGEDLRMGTVRNINKRQGVKS